MIFKAPLYIEQPCSADETEIGCETGLYCTFFFLSIVQYKKVWIMKKKILSLILLTSFLFLEQTAVLAEPIQGHIETTDSSQMKQKDIFTKEVKKLETAEMDELLRAILSLESVEEAYEFFEDLCTVNEMVAMKQRFEVAKMLREERTYQDIADETGASSATISRVNRALNYGNDGYDLVLKRLGM